MAGSNNEGQGVNILTIPLKLTMPDAESAVERYAKGEITAEELYAAILDAEIIVESAAQSEKENTV